MAGARFSRGEAGGLDDGVGVRSGGGCRSEIGQHRDARGDAELGRCARRCHGDNRRAARASGLGLTARSPDALRSFIAMRKMEETTAPGAV